MDTKIAHPWIVEREFFARSSNQQLRTYCRHRMNLIEQGADNSKPK
jgi:hypothetical protein